MRHTPTKVLLDSSDKKNEEVLLRTDKVLRKLGSISALNSRNNNTGLRAASSIRNRMDHAYSQSSQSQARNHRVENSERIKLDKVSISEEAKNIHYSPRGDRDSEVYSRLEAYNRNRR